MAKSKVPKGVIRGVEDIDSGDTASKDEIEEVLKHA